MLNPRDYIFTFRDAVALMRRCWAAVRGASLRDALGVVGLLAAGLALQIVFRLPADAIGLWLLAAAMLYWRLDGRYAIGVALVCLAAFPILSALESRKLSLNLVSAEQASIWAFFLLTIGLAVLAVGRAPKPKRTKRSPSRSKR